MRVLQTEIHRDFLRIDRNTMMMHVTDGDKQTWVKADSIKDKVKVSQKK